MEENLTEKYQNRGELFSKEALDKMRTPEQLDTFLPITNPIGWMGLIAVCVLMVAVVIWSIYGSFTVKAEGMGLIMDARGIMKVTSLTAGNVDELYVAPGMKIAKGERVAHVDEARENASTRMAQYGPELAVSGRDAQNKVHEFDSRRYQQETIEYITASDKGIVDEVMVSLGSMVTAGTTLCTIRVEGNNNNLTGVLYVPVDKGKRVEPGMKIQLVPSGVDASQSGSLLATVRTVSMYPSSMQAVAKKLGNDNLAQWIFQAQQGAVMEVNFELVKDESEPSGYLWTSQVGEHKKITPGSFCTGSIIIEKKPPIEKVFRKLSQWLRNA